MKYFLDTNCLIHYQLFSEVNWKKEFKDDCVVLVICPAVIKELDYKKFAEQDINIRERCQLVIRKLSDCIDGKIQKTNTDIIFISREPKINWDSENLSTEIPDDRIIASVIDYGNIEESFIVTADLGLGLKANLKGIKKIELSTELFQQLSDDTKDREIKKLNDKVNRLESKHPVIILKLNIDNHPSDFVKFKIHTEIPYSSKDIEDAILSESQTLSYVKPQINNHPLMNTLGSLMIPDEKEIKRYEAECKEYIPKLRKYYQDDNKWKNRLSRTYKLQFCLESVGTVPAEDIDVYMHFPNGFELSKENIESYEIKKPERPLKPQTPAEIMRNISLYPGLSVRDMDFSTPHGVQPIQNSFISSIKKTNSYEVEFHVNKLKHNQSLDLSPLFIIFNSFEEIKSFEIEYRLSIGNHPEITNGELRIIFA